MNNAPFDNYFTLFKLPEKFVQNIEIIKSRYYQLQQSMHPDQLINQSQETQAIALSYAAKISEAYHTLKDPFSRAKYLLMKQGKFWANEMSVKPNLPLELLMEQMALREELEALLSDSETHSVEWQLFKNKIETQLSYFLQQLNNIDNPETSEDDLKTLFQQIPFYTRLKTTIQNRENE